MAFRYDSDCSICLETMQPILVNFSHNDGYISVCFEENKNTEKKTLACFHAFHQSCINAWIEKKAECPICKKKIVHPESPVIEAQSLTSRLLRIIVSRFSSPNELVLAIGPLRDELSLMIQTARQMNQIQHAEMSQAHVPDSSSRSNL